MASGMPLTSLSLTFGVELEFGLKRPVDETENPANSPPSRPWVHLNRTVDINDNTRRAVVKLLSSDAVGLRARMAYQKSDQVVFNAPSATSISSMYDAWQADEDYSIRFTAAEAGGPGFTYVPIELISPVFSANSPAAEAELGRAIEAVRTHFDTAVNVSCGLHVHVGSVRDDDGRRGFPIATLRALATLVTCCERPLSTLLPQERHNAFHCVPPSRVECLRMRAPLERLAVLWRQPDVSGLYYYFNDNAGRYYAYNLANLADYPSDRGAGFDGDNDIDIDNESAASTMLQTIEFRQFPGCLDADTIVAWARVVCRLVEFAHAFSNDAGPLPMLEQALRRVPPWRPANGHDILRAIDLEELVPYFPLHPASMPEDQDIVPHVMLTIPALRHRAKAKDLTKQACYR